MSDEKEDTDSVADDHREHRSEHHAVTGDREYTTERAGAAVLPASLSTRSPPTTPLRFSSATIEVVASLITGSKSESPIPKSNASAPSDLTPGTNGINAKQIACRPSVTSNVRRRERRVTHHPAVGLSRIRTPDMATMTPATNGVVPRTRIAKIGMKVTKPKSEKNRTNPPSSMTSMLTSPISSAIDCLYSPRDVRTLSVASDSGAVSGTYRYTGIITNRPSAYR